MPRASRLGTQHEAIAVPIDALSDVLFVREIPSSISSLRQPENLAALAAFAGLSLALALGLSRTVVRPIQALTERLPGFFDEAETTSDSLPTPLPETERKDEIGQLATALSNAREQLAKERERRAHSERLAMLGRMATGLAHEIKNPLTPMKLNIQHLKRVVESHPDDINERVNRVSEMLIEQIDSLSHIATEFSNFAKLPNPNLEPVNLADVLQSIADLFQQNTRCHLSLQSPDELWILADKEQCLRIFTNLLKNAEQSIPESRIGNIEVFAFVLEDSVTVKVKDNGCGIPEEIKPKLFTPNFTTKSTGTGLGLAMVKSAIVSFNGSINFETELNKGTMFTIVLPLLKM